MKDTDKLTRQHYKDFGFIWNQKHCDWTKSNFRIVLWEHDIILVNAFTHIDESDFTYCIKPATVGDLKNLYKTLTGNELTETGFELTI